ncbi:MAG TPA: deoxynucleoside kinase [Candidatus Krumholzibacteria bacterium]|nr:deoxynucleoside kinase [Candidatus Krumholzibacteria bacterium]
MDAVYAEIRERILARGCTRIAIEGNIGVGKTSLARMIVRRLGGRLVEDRVEDNPFLERFYEDAGAYAFQTQLVFLMNRYKQQLGLRQNDLFADLVVFDYVFARDRIFANVILSDDELALYERIASELEARVSQPDLAVYLQASAPVLFDRVQLRGRDYERALSRDYLDALNDAFNHYFFNYSAAPLLIVNTDAMDFVNDERHFADLLRRISEPVVNTEFYVPSWETR